MWYSSLGLILILMLMLGWKGYARYGRAQISLSIESKLLVTIMLCSVIMLAFYTQTDFFTTYTPVPISEKLLLRDVYVPGFDNPIPELCVGNGTNLTVLIVVTSAPHHSKYRMAIRDTWASFPGHTDYQVAFIVGIHPDPVVMQELAEESALHNDVIINRNADSYWNLALKTASILEWVSTFCLNASYMLKTDDDMFINVPRLKEFIKTTQQSENNIYGYVCEYAKPIRTFSSRWYVSKEDFSGTFFPKYITGAGYLMPVDVATVLFEAAQNMTFFNIEDAFFTGVVAQRVGVGRVPMPGITYFTPQQQRKEVRDAIIVVELGDPNRNYLIYSLLIDYLLTAEDDMYSG